MRQVSKLAKAMGPVGLSALRDVVLDLTSGPSAAQFTPYHRRHFARLFYEEGVMPRDQTVTLGLSSTADADDDDPAQRQESCLEIAAFLHGVGDQTGSENWKRRANKVSAGVWQPQGLPHGTSGRMAGSIDHSSGFGSIGNSRSIRTCRRSFWGRAVGRMEQQRYFGCSFD